MGEGSAQAVTGMRNGEPNPLPTPGSLLSMAPLPLAMMERAGPRARVLKEVGLRSTPPNIAAADTVITCV